MMPLRQLSREQPNIFLIVGKIFRQAPPGYFSIRGRLTIVDCGSGDLGRTVRQTRIVVLRKGPIGCAENACAEDENEQPQLSCFAHRGSLMQFLEARESGLSLYHLSLVTYHLSWGIYWDTKYRDSF
jgi:hypothetical protein